MPLYVTLGNWTDQGTRDFGGAVQRANGFRELVEQAGGRVRELVWTMGEYDFIILAEAPDDETAPDPLIWEHNLGVAKSWKCLLRLHDWEDREDPETHKQYKICLRCDA